MESRILDACREDLAGQIAPRAQILDVGSTDPHRCDLLLERTGKDGGRARLVVDLSPARPCLYLARPQTTVSGSEQLRRLLVGKWITGVDRPTAGPVLRLVLAPPGGRDVASWLVFEWLGGSPGAVVVDPVSGEVLASLGEPTGPARARRERGASYHWPSSPHKPAYDRATAEQTKSILDAARDAGHARALARGFSGLPTFLAHEAVHRGGSDPSALAAALRAIASESFSPTLYAIPDPPAGLQREFVSPIPLRSLASFEAKRPGGLFRLLEHAHEAALRIAAEDQVRNSWLRLLSREESRLIRLRERLAEELREASGAPDLRLKAEAILIHLKEVPRGAKQLECPDPKEPSQILQIDLDPRMSAAANAETLFKRARRLEKGALLRARRVRALEEAIAKLASLREEATSKSRLLPTKGALLLRAALGHFVREGVLAAWAKEIATGGMDVRSEGSDVRSGRARTRSAGTEEGGRPRDAGTPPRPRPAGRRGENRFHPRSFKTKDGWTVLVGRSNQENDYVTHRLAKPDDYWFHVHGCPGSHVILRREGRKDNPSARTIEEVAAIAAFFSKARTSRKAPVIYTLKKYVRKARGGSPGLAIVTRERTIMVVPEASVDAGPPGWGDEEI